MLKRYFLLIILVISLAATPFLLEVFHVHAEPRTDRTYESIEETFSISLDSRDVDQTRQSIDLNDFNYPAPEICDKPEVACFETSNITINVVKTWEIAEISEITSEELTPDVFALYYPDVPSVPWEELREDPESIMIIQRTLYERGLLDVLPTGQYGYLTEEAIIKLQSLKDISEIDYTAGQVIVGTETTEALNSLKRRMAEPFYLDQNPLPSDYSEIVPTVHKRRLDEIDTALKSFRPTPEQKETVNKNKENAKNISPEVEALNGSQLEYYGEATIQK